MPTSCILAKVTAPSVILAIGRVPDVIAAPFKLVKDAPLIAGNAPDNLDAVSVEILASATVPVKFHAGRLVKDAPEPLNVVALAVPFTSNFCVGLSVPIPTFKSVNISGVSNEAASVSCQFAPPVM